MRQTKAGTLLLAGMFALTACFIGFAGENDKKPVLTFLDTLNKGKELAVTAADFPPPPPAPPAVQAPADTLSGAATSGTDHEAGVVPSRFKVQVLASAQEQEVRKEKNSLAAKISLPVTVAFEAPYYKLFAGDFAQRSEAEPWCTQLKDMGYKDAWIVRTAASQKPR